MDVVTFKPRNEEARVLKVDKRDGLTYWTPEGVGAKTPVSPQEHEAIKKHDDLLRELAQWRSEQCVWHNCYEPAIVWAAEVKFDLRHPDASLDKLGTESTTDLMHTELPGFCWKHITDKPSELAQLIFYNTPAAQWGWKPTRWIIKFTDGSNITGDVQEIVLPMMPAMIVAEEYIQNPNANEVIEEEADPPLNSK